MTLQSIASKSCKHHILQIRSTTNSNLLSGKSSTKSSNLIPTHRNHRCKRIQTRMSSKASDQKSLPQLLRIHPVNTDQDLQHFKSLTVQYLDWLAEDLCYQGIDDELASYPGVFATEAKGAMLLAFNNADECIGAVALRSLQGKALDDLDSIQNIPIADICEMKRLFVQPAFHGTGAGAALAVAIIEEAKKLGYTAVVLDTLERLTRANQLYKKLGFSQCEPYNICPLDGPLYWIKRIDNN